MSSPPLRGEEKGSYAKIAKRGAMWSMVRQSIRGLLAFPSSMILARLLAPQDFGIGAALTLVIQFASRLTQLGLNAALVRLKTVDDTHEGTVFASNLLQGVLLYALLVLGADIAGRVVNSPEAAAAIPFAALTFLISPFSAVPSARLSRALRPQDAARADFVDLLLAQLVTVASAALGFGYWSFVYGGLTGSLAATLTRIGMTSWTPSFRVSRAAWHEMLRFGAGVQAKRILEYAGQNADTLVIGNALGMTALGFYDKAFSFMNRIALRFVLAPGTSFRIYSVLTQDSDRFRRAYQRMASSVLMAALPLFIGMGVAAPELFTVMFGVNWITSAPAFRWLVVAGALQIYGSVLNPVNEAAGQIWLQVWGQALFVALVAAFVFVGVQWGVVGAAVGVVAAAGLRTLIMMHVLGRATGWSLWSIAAPLQPGLVVGAAVGVTMAGVRELPFTANWNPFILLGTDILLAGMVALGMVLWCPVTTVRAVADDVLGGMAPPRVATWYRRIAATPR